VRALRYSEAKAGRVFVIRLEDGDVIHESLERFARDNGVRRAQIIALGALDEGSSLVVGPEDGKASPVIPMKVMLDRPREITGVGTIFPDEKGDPVLHMHIATGRKETTITGCVRAGVVVWKVVEVIITEILDNGSVRRMDQRSGFELLEPEP
jgi:predicted DNA-binding protein with PD1-like motif